MNKAIAGTIFTCLIGLRGCGGSAPTPDWDTVPPNITAITVSEAAYQDWEVPNLTPPQRLNVDMDQIIGPLNSGIPDMLERCHNMGGELIDDTCFNVDY